MRYLAAFIVLFVGQLPLSAEQVGVVNGATGGARLQRDGQTYQPVAGSELRAGDGVNISSQGGLSYRTAAGDYIVVGGPTSLTLAQGSINIPSGIVRAVVRHALTLQMGNHRLDANRGVFEISTLNGTATISVAAGTGKLTLSDQTTYDLVAGEMVEIDAEGGLTVVQRDPRLQQRMQEIMLTIAGATSRKLRGTQLDAVAQSEDMQSQNDYTLDFGGDDNANQPFATNNNQDQQEQDSTTRSQDAVAIAGSPTLNLPSVGSSPGLAGSPGGSGDFNRNSTVNTQLDPTTERLLSGPVHFITAERVSSLPIRVNPGELSGQDNAALNSRFWSIGRAKSTLPNETLDKTNFDVKTGPETIREAKDAFLVPTTNLVLVDFGDLRNDTAAGKTFDPADPRINVANQKANIGLDAQAPIENSDRIKVSGDPLDASPEDASPFDFLDPLPVPVQVGASQEDDHRFKESGPNFINPLLTYVFGNFRFTDTGDGVEVATRRSDQDRRVSSDKNASDTTEDNARDGVTFVPGIKDNDDSISVPKTFSDLPTSIGQLPRDFRAALTVATGETLKDYARRTNQTRFVIDGQIIDITGYKPRP